MTDSDIDGRRDRQIDSQAAGPGPVWGIVLGGGSGARFGGAKQFAELDGVSLLERSLMATRTACDGVVCVVPDPSASAVRGFATSADRVVAGGSDRAASVRAGLAAVPATAQVIVVADAAHPLASPTLFATVVAQVRGGADGAVPGLPPSEVIAVVNPDGTRGAGVPREGHVLVQMPQAFRAEALRAAHAGAPACGQAAQAGQIGVEDSAMVAALIVDGRRARVVVVPGEITNLHVTTPEELDLARRLVSGG